MAGDLTRLTAIAAGHGGLISATFPTALTWDQRARAGLLFAGKQAALSHHASGHLHGLIPAAPEVIEILVPHNTLLTPATGLLVRRTRRRFAVVGDPHRTNLVDTVLDLADDATRETDVLDILTGGIRKGAKPERVLREMERRRYFENRSLLNELLARTADGVESPLELRFHTNVTVAHGLPLPQRQVRERVRGYWIRSDCWYEGFGLRVELDGELAHPGRATHRDVLRDNDVLLMTGDVTLRYRWWHTLNGACVSAAQLATGLNRGSWVGEPTPCGPRCTVVREYSKLRGTLWG